MSSTHRIIAALDSYKGSLSSYAAGAAVRRGILRRLPNSIVDVFSLGDGGEGTAAAFRGYGKSHQIEVFDTHRSKTNAEYIELIKDSCRYAIFDMAECAGLSKSATHDLDILHATTYGVGEIISALVYKGYDEIIVGLGGSGTNDAGIGALQAMGAVFLDKNNEPLDASLGAVVLPEISSVDLSKAVSMLSHTKLTLLYDVSSPLTGSSGASMMFSKQKGADIPTGEFLENAVGGFSRIVDSLLKYEFSAIPGAGAAGGLGYGLSLIGGQLTPGARFVLDYLNLADTLKSADLVITGEGKTDIQTAKGKLPAVVADYARRSGCPVICLSGSYEPSPDIERLFDAIFSISLGPDSLENSIRKTEALLEEASYNIAGLLDSISKC